MAELYNSDSFHEPICENSLARHTRRITNRKHKKATGEENLTSCSWFPSVHHCFNTAAVITIPSKMSKQQYPREFPPVPKRIAPTESVTETAPAQVTRRIVSSLQVAFLTGRCSALFGPDVLPKKEQPS